MNVTEAEAIVGEPAPDWVARCYEIAHKLAEAAGGTAVFGHWLGGIAPGSHFAARSQHGFVQHGWVERPDGTILDPTRWVFEDAEPYIYDGINDGGYDRGGNALREMMLTTPPVPDVDANHVLLRLEGAALGLVEALLGQPGDLVTEQQVHWLANVPVHMLGEHVAEVYREIVARDLEAFIPIDNRRMVLGGAE